MSEPTRREEGYTSWRETPTRTKAFVLLVWVVLGFLFFRGPDVLGLIWPGAGWGLLWIVAFIVSLTLSLWLAVSTARRRRAAEGRSVLDEDEEMAPAPGVGARIRDLRTDRGLTQEDLADLVGVRQGAISEYETGRKGMMLATAVTFADALGVSLDELVGRDGPKES